ncbi:MAG: hypothetical protein K0R92_3453 [Lachnospiraceae bacterium]|jgi:hypothetical protein|nr:hypothetical protein [Lachnospiraceae bacterium]
MKGKTIGYPNKNLEELIQHTLDIIRLADKKRKGADVSIRLVYLIVVTDEV